MTQVSFKINELEELMKNKDSGIILIPKCSREVILSPTQLQDFKNSFKNILYSTVAKYDHELDGIILSYKRVKINDNFTVNFYETGQLNFTYTADIYLFKPQTGAILTGIINKKGPDHFGCLVHKVFNIAIPRPDDVKEDQWIGAKLKFGQKVQFKVVDIDLSEYMPYIKGKLIETPGDCGKDNYNMEDMVLCSDLEINIEETKSNEKYSKTIDDYAIANVSDSNDRTEYPLEEEKISKDGIYSCAQIFMKDYYDNYSKTFSNLASHKLKNRCKFNCSPRNIDTVILFLCDLFNYEVFYNDYFTRNVCSEEINLPSSRRNEVYNCCNLSDSSKVGYTETIHKLIKHKKRKKKKSKNTRESYSKDENSDHKKKNYKQTIEYNDHFDSNRKRKRNDDIKKYATLDCMSIKKAKLQQESKLDNYGDRIKGDGSDCYKKVKKKNKKKRKRKEKTNITSTSNLDVMSIVKKYFSSKQKTKHKKRQKSN